MRTLGVLKKPANPSLTLALLHFDGASGTQVFTDSSPTNQNFTPNSSNTGVYLSNTWTKFGATSCFFNGASFLNYLTTPVGTGYLGSPLTNQEWQIDCWVRPSIISSQKGLFCLYSGSTRIPINLKIVNGVLTLQVQVTDVSVWDYTITHQTPLVANSEYHVRSLRKNGVLRLFLNGIEASSTANIGTASLVNGGQGNMYLGVAFDNIGGFPQQFNGYLDEFRFRKEAVYTGNFTPPTAPFTY